MDITQSDGSCFLCCDGNVPDSTKTRCVKATQAQAPVKGRCVGDREIYNKAKTDCIKCMPYTRAQRSNTVCLSDQCGSNQIITVLGTCADCGDGLRPDANRGSCVGPGPTKLNALVEMEETEDVNAAPENATKKRSFPTVIVAGLTVLILVLTAATALICYRSRQKTSFNPQVVEQEMTPQEGNGDDENDK